MATSGVLEKRESVNLYQCKRYVRVRSTYICFSYPAAIYGIWLMITSANVYTFLFTIALWQVSGLGITAGAHRLWTHRSYKAKLPLRIILIVFNTISFTEDVIQWAADHRVHHKYSDTDADPYNASRGFFFSHVGWLLQKKHPEVYEKQKGIDISDLTSDPILSFQRKYFYALVVLWSFIFPITVAVCGWDETIWNAFFISCMFRWNYVANMSFLINSVAHLWGNRPYDANIKPTQNSFLAIFTLGESWHNYHHVFPWDYKAAELGNYKMNFTTAFIDFCAKIGWAYDLKSVSSEMIKKRVERTGDGTFAWGWGDKDQHEDDISHAIITHQLDPKCQ